MQSRSRSLPDEGRRTKATGSFANASSRRRRLLSVVRVVSRPGKPTITKAVDSLKGSVLRTESGIRYGSWYSTLQSFSGTASWKSGSTANSFVPKNFRNRKTATGAANAAMRTITFLPFIIIKKRGLSFHSSRSEERRVGKGCKSEWEPDHVQKSERRR